MNLIERLKSDVTYVVGYLRILATANSIKPDSEVLVADVVEDTVDHFPERTFIVFDGKESTYADFEREANRFANWGLSIGLKPGDCVALFMDNRPEYVAFWSGMAKIAVKTALINYNLSGAGLSHCIKVANARALVLNAELAPAFETARIQTPLELGAWTLGGEAPGMKAMNPQLAGVSAERPPRTHRAGIKASEIALYIYTSGTTGLPKAAKITHVRARGLMSLFVTAVGVTRHDRILETLPLYHATGGMCGVGCALTTGAALILQKKFSASHFWQEAIDTKATMLVYIGELGRYLMNQPASTLEHSHSIVKGFGNGLRADVWAEFVERTGIRHLVEFYGSTEGNVNFFNLDGKVGAVGRIPPILRSKLQTRMLKFDVETEQPVRGADGFCIEAADDEPGEAVGPITDEARQRFEGYNDPEQTKKKVLTDVFARGDKWFRTGDLMRKDKDGYIYFVDRVGDTFRWKSENVSTGEVEIALGSMAGVEQAVVYGVKAPGYEGRAGMAAVMAPKGVDMALLYAHVAAELPAYARPVFVRLKNDIETTGTLKVRKVDLVKEGFDPLNTSDPLFVADAEKKTYVPIDQDMLRDIVSGKFRL